MKVKFSYTTDYDKVPEECWRLLDGKIHDGFAFKEGLQKVYSELGVFGASDFDAVSAIQKIHKLRLLLAEYDETLGDIQSIIDGWMKIDLQSGNQDATLNEEPQTQPVSPENLLESLKALKEITEAKKKEIE